eukprot:TRINITY_DN3556_c0_g1_i1.p1 TRINITY_DN3556_c0_g1~~TRINITY_DN3556_c0_g1_i1.p1  ORF type:complete len:266 (-),score=35.32 TRINITY_DN3556_c0_g1_i1:111-908(-)
MVDTTNYARNSTNEISFPVSTSPSPSPSPTSPFTKQVPHPPTKQSLMAGTRLAFRIARRPEDREQFLSDFLPKLFKEGEQIWNVESAIQLAVRWRVLISKWRKNMSDILKEHPDQKPTSPADIHGFYRAKLSEQQLVQFWVQGMPEITHFLGIKKQGSEEMRTSRITNVYATPGMVDVAELFIGTVLYSDQSWARNLYARYTAIGTTEHKKNGPNMDYPFETEFLQMLDTLTVNDNIPDQILTPIVDDCLRNHNKLTKKRKRSST